MRDILISTVKEVDVKQGRKATVVFVPYRAWKSVKKVPQKAFSAIDTEEHG